MIEAIERLINVEIIIIIIITNYATFNKYIKFINQIHQKKLSRKEPGVPVGDMGERRKHVMAFKCLCQ